MSRPLDPLALFRLSVLAPLASRDRFERGEITAVIHEMAGRTYNIPGSRRTHLSEETILRWYRLWKRGGIDALAPKTRRDLGETQLSVKIQSALIMAKQDNPARSMNTLIRMLEAQGVVAKSCLARSSVHRFLKKNRLSGRAIKDNQRIERRAFVAEHAGDIWQGDVLHGPSVQTLRGMKKTYLVSLLDDASRLIAHSAFCLGETALDIEGVLKQAVLKRGLPRKLIIDNGPAYRAGSLQSICAKLEIRLVYCRPYEPEGKGKLERFHRTFREQFLDEIEPEKLSGLNDLNERLWAWTEQVYHRRIHGGLEWKTPLERWQADLVHVQPLGLKAVRIDDIFCHRTERTVRKDGTISWEGRLFEVAHSLADEKVTLVFDPHAMKALRIESAFGDDLGAVVSLDAHANLTRKRQRPHHTPPPARRQGDSAVEMALQEYRRTCSLPVLSAEKE